MRGWFWYEVQREHLERCKLKLMRLFRTNRDCRTARIVFPGAPGLSRTLLLWGAVGRHPATGCELSAALSLGLRSTRMPLRGVHEAQP